MEDRLPRYVAIKILTTARDRTCFAVSLYDAVDSVACLECDWRITDQMFMCWPAHKHYRRLKPTVQKRVEPGKTQGENP